MQVTQQTMTEALAPMRDGWPMGWSDWPYGGWTGLGGSDTVQFTTAYSGKLRRRSETHAPCGATEH
jgi:hypothetical protein